MIKDPALEYLDCAFNSGGSDTAALLGSRRTVISPARKHGDFEASKEGL